MPLFLRAGRTSTPESSSLFPNSLSCTNSDADRCCSTIEDSAGLCISASEASQFNHGWPYLPHSRRFHTSCPYSPKCTEAQSNEPRDKHTVWAHFLTKQHFHQTAAPAFGHPGSGGTFAKEEYNNTSQTTAEPANNNRKTVVTVCAKLQEAQHLPMCEWSPGGSSNSPQCCGIWGLLKAGRKSLWL